jgi:antirestriction protein ArdC
MQATTSLPQHSSVYQIVTEQIIKQLESGTAPWHKPWHCETPRNLISKKEYRGLNVLALASQGYGSPHWLTFNQAKALGAHVRKGERSTLVTFWKIGKYEKQDPDSGELETRKSVLLRYYRVFNIEQCEGVSALHSTRTVVNPIEECEGIVSQMPNSPKYEQDARAWYRPSTDTVGMPSRNAFNSAPEYHSTLFHELTHSTGHPSRIGREGIEKLNTFGSESYSREELVAEIGAAMLCGIAGIAPRTLDNSAAYLQSWIQILKGDSRLVISAATQAQRAADYILGKIQPDAGKVGAA